MIECRVCSAPANAWLCRSCTAELKRALAELPRDLADLQAVATRQAAGPLGLGDSRSGVQWDGPFEAGALGDAPWDFAPGAADQIWAASNTLSTWVRHLAETRKVAGPIAERGRWESRRRIIIERNRAGWFHFRVFTPDPEQPIGILVRWLQDHLESIRHDEAVAEIHDEITGMQRENARWTLGRAGNEVFAGTCDGTRLRVDLTEDQTLIPVAARCGVALYGHEGEGDVRCPACASRYELQPRLDEIRSAQINDQLARAHAIADALTTLEEPLGRDLLRKWIQRDADRMPAPEGPACEGCRHATCRSIRRPPILPQGVDEDGHPLYRFGDVRRRLQLVEDQRGAKLTA